MELKVGMYVRFKNGEVTKIKRYNEENNNPLFETINSEVKMKGQVSKASLNIIDLVREGDYVNGHKVIKIDYQSVNNEQKPIIYTTDQEYWCGGYGCMRYDYTLRNTIKEILTKEQYESMVYKL